MNDLYSNSPMTQSNMPQPITAEAIEAMKQQPERIVMQEPMYIVSPSSYKYMEDKGHIKNGELTKKGMKLMFG